MKLVKPIPIELDKPRTLFFDLNAMCSFEEASGKGVFDLGDKLTAKDTRALLWAMLLREDKALTLEQVGAMITPSAMPEIARAIVEAMKAALPEPEPKDGGSPLLVSPSP